MNQWSEKSRTVYNTLHNDLKQLMSTVLQIHDCSLIEGHRDRETHEEYLRRDPPVTTIAYEQTKHRCKPSIAVDVVPYIPGKGPWDERQIMYYQGIVKGVAERLYAEGKMRHRIRQGVDWDGDNDVGKYDTTFFDGPHVELIME